VAAERRWFFWLLGPLFPGLAPRFWSWMKAYEGGVTGLAVKTE